MMRTGLLFSMTALSAAVCMLATGCNDENKKEEPKTPVITLTAGTAELNALSFNISASDATALAWICIEEGEETPSAAEVLETGTQADPLSETEITVSDLKSATDYKIVASAANGDIVIPEPEVLELSTVSDLFADVTSTATQVWYYGYQEATDNDLILLQMCNAGLDELTGMPYGEGQLLRFYLYTEKTSVDNTVLAPGTYVMSVDQQYGTFTYDADNSVFAMSTAEGWMQAPYESGTVTVEYADGTYSIVAEMVLADGESSKVRGRYEGSLDIADMTDGYHHFDTDMNEVMTGLSGGIYPGDGVLNDYTMTFYNCPLDADGFIIGAGYLFNTELFFTAGEEDYTGTYKPNNDWMSGYVNYTYLPGDVMNMYGMYMPYGTYLSEYDDSGNLIRIGLVVDGEINVTRADGNVTMSAVLTTDKGHEISVSYNGPENVTDMTGGTSAAINVRTMQQDNPDRVPPVSGWQPLR